jgi:hypothetical protein
METSAVTVLRGGDANALMKRLKTRQRIRQSDRQLSQSEDSLLRNPLGALRMASTRGLSRIGCGVQLTLIIINDCSADMAWIESPITPLPNATLWHDQLHQVVI